MQCTALSQRGDAVLKCTVCNLNLLNLGIDCTAVMNKSGQVITVLCTAACKVAVCDIHVGIVPNFSVIGAEENINSTAFFTGPAVCETGICKFNARQIALDRAAASVVRSGGTVAEDGIFDG